MDEREERPEDADADAPAEGDRPVEAPSAPPRRYPSTIGGACYLVVLATVAVGLWVTHDSDWRVGVRVVGIALGVAAALRLVLPARDAGMLAVRQRWVDVGLLAAVAAALVFLAGNIPNQPG